MYLIAPVTTQPPPAQSWAVSPSAKPALGDGSKNPPPKRSSLLAPRGPGTRTPRKYFSAIRFLSCDRTQYNDNTFKRVASRKRNAPQ